MLGISFFQRTSHQTICFKRSSESSEERVVPQDVRNGFWIEVMRFVKQSNPQPRAKQSSSLSAEPPASIRAVQSIYCLNLEFCFMEAALSENESFITEDGITFWTVAGIICSELSSMALATVTGVMFLLGNMGVSPSDLWIIRFFYIPLCLKLAALVLSVRREKLKFEFDDDASLATITPPMRTNTDPADISAAPVKASNHFEVFEVVCPSIGCILITVDKRSLHLMLQFFRHYGHPIRSTQNDRLRELASIAVIYCFLLYFPIGLLLLSWMTGPIQYIWLGQQVYCVIAMHISRLFGWQGCGRTEERAANLLISHGVVCLRGENGYVRATMEIKQTQSVATARALVKEIIEKTTEGSIQNTKYN